MNVCYLNSQLRKRRQLTLTHSLFAEAKYVSIYKANPQHKKIIRTASKQLFITAKETKSKMISIVFRYMAQNICIKGHHTYHENVSNAQGCPPNLKTTTKTAPCTRR